MSQTLSALTTLGAGRDANNLIAEALILDTALEISTTPIGTSSAGFTFAIDPKSKLPVRTAKTFGPSFAERALTAGAGRLSVGANLIVATYDNLGDFPLQQTPLASATRTVPGPFSVNNYNAYMSLVLTTTTTAISANLGATDNLDFGVIVPIVQVKLEGRSWEENDRVPVKETVAAAQSTGLGDLALVAKYRLLKFGPKKDPTKQDAPKKDPIDPGGLGLLVTMRLPTGEPSSLRGLGVTRTMVALVASGGRDRFRPHGNAGYEWWSDSVNVDDFGGIGTRPFQPLDPATSAPARIVASGQFQYAAGVEFEATPKLTLLADVLGRHVRGAGQIGTRTQELSQPVVDATGFRELTLLSALPGNLQKVTLAPGLKWNIRGSVLLALSALVSLKDTGLHDKFTPVVGLDWSF
jgi:hypothetical protein